MDFNREDDRIDLYPEVHQIGAMGLTTNKLKDKLKEVIAS